MKRLIISILTLLTIVPAYAQNSEQLLKKTVSKLEKDGGIAMKLDCKTKFENGSDFTEIEIRMSGTCFYAQSDDNTIWFDGKTMWRGNDFGDGIEEIYITEPAPQERARYDIINLLGKHQGFSVSGNGTDTFTLTASDSQRSVEGINKVTVLVDPKTYVPSVINIHFSEELGDISAKVQVISYKPDQTFDKSTFTCPVQKYKDADIIDLR